MKIEPEHFQMLQTTLAPLVNETTRADYKARGLTALRYRWDLLWQSRFDVAILHYLTDAQIDTALRKIVGTK